MKVKFGYSFINDSEKINFVDLNVDLPDEKFNCYDVLSKYLNVKQDEIFIRLVGITNFDTKKDFRPVGYQYSLFD